MPNIKSAEKRVKVINKKTAENRAVKSRVLTYTKKFKAALETGDKAQAEEAYRKVVSLLDKAVSDKVYHANYASRRKAHFAKLLADMKVA